MFTLGRWENYQHLEDALSLDELYATFEEMNETEWNKNKFAASLKGIDLDEERAKVAPEGDVRSFETLKKRAQWKIDGLSEDEIEQRELADLGLAPMSEN